MTTIKSFHTRVIPRRFFCFLLTLVCTLWFSASLKAEDTTKAGDLSSQSVDESSEKPVPIYLAFGSTIKSQALFSFTPVGNFLQAGLRWEGSMLFLGTKGFAIGPAVNLGLWSPSTFYLGVRRPAIELIELGVDFQYQPQDIGLRASILGGFGQIAGTVLSFVYPGFSVCLFYQNMEEKSPLAIGLDVQFDLRKDPTPTFSAGLSIRLQGIVPL